MDHITPELADPRARQSELGAIVHRDPADLAAGYSKSFRKIEILSLIIYHAMTVALVVRLTPFFEDAPARALLVFLLGLVTADFVSGFVHWLGDTWGTPEWPLIGQTLIRTFREHHVDQLSITRHDFIETNATNCLISLPVLIFCLLIPLHEGQHTRAFLVSWLVSMTTWVYATNQIHKWAHEKNPKASVAILQRFRFILSPDHHAIHHSAPYSKYYCITTGWLNPILTAIGFFPFMEKLLSALTGAIPRQDDIGKTAALIALAEEESSREEPGLS